MKNNCFETFLIVCLYRFGAPAFISFPHFYLADPSYREPIEGMHPNKSKHEFFVSLEPNTGIPLQVRAQMQINILIEEIAGIEYVVLLLLLITFANYLLFLQYAKERA